MDEGRRTRDIWLRATHRQAKPQRGSFVVATLVASLMLRNFKIFGRSQLQLTTGYMHAVVSFVVRLQPNDCPSPSGDGSYQLALQTGEREEWFEDDENDNKGDVYCWDVFGITSDVIRSGWRPGYDL